MKLKGKIALVTGSSRGIGKSIAGKLAESGATVIINGTSNPARIEQVTSELKSKGYECLGIMADISTKDGITHLVNTVMETYGSIDILVNNAGITRDNLVIKMSEEEWDDVIRINLTSVFLCTKASIRSMIKKRWGRIINISSIIGLSGNAGQANYAASKAGIIGFTKAMAKEVGSRGITVNALAPGFIETDMTHQMDSGLAEKIKTMTALGRYGTPDDVAEAVAFLASDQAGYITGQVIGIDGGLTGL
jgi:3-oxoacyl-[acyl-carrier protein] reductase